MPQSLWLKNRSATSCRWIAEKYSGLTQRKLSSGSCVTGRVSPATRAMSPQLSPVSGSTLVTRCVLHARQAIHAFENLPVKCRAVLVIGI